MGNKWTDFVKEFRKQNSHILSYRDALKGAKEPYKLHEGDIDRYLKSLGKPKKQVKKKTVKTKK